MAIYLAQSVEKVNGSAAGHQGARAGEGVQNSQGNLHFQLSLTVKKKKINMFSKFHNSLVQYSKLKIVQFDILQYSKYKKSNFLLNYNFIFYLIYVLNYQNLFHILLPNKGEDSQAVPHLQKLFLKKPSMWNNFSFILKFKSVNISNSLTKF